MNKLIKGTLLAIVMLILAACGAQSTTPTAPSPSQVSTVNPETSYPAGTANSSNTPYPNQAETLVPAYLKPGFITATPDASIADIAISEVRHENGVETIVLKNISQKSQDISAYMLYSPALDSRKILPGNLVLKAGETFEIYNGADLSAFPEVQRWLPTEILKKALDEVWLTNAAARVIYYFTFYPPVTE